MGGRTRQSIDPERPQLARPHQCFPRSSRQVETAGTLARPSSGDSSDGFSLVPSNTKSLGQGGGLRSRRSSAFARLELTGTVPMSVKRPSTPPSTHPDRTGDRRYIIQPLTTGQMPYTQRGHSGEEGKPATPVSSEVTHRKVVGNTHTFSRVAACHTSITR